MVNSYGRFLNPDSLWFSSSIIVWKSECKFSSKILWTMKERRSCMFEKTRGWVKNDRFLFLRDRILKRIFLPEQQEHFFSYSQFQVFTANYITWLIALFVKCVIPTPTNATHRKAWNSDTLSLFLYKNFSLSMHTVESLLFLPYLPGKRWKSTGEETVKERLSPWMMPPALPSSCEQHWVSLPHNQHDLSTPITSLRKQSASCQTGHCLLWSPLSGSKLEQQLCVWPLMCVCASSAYVVLFSDHLFSGSFVFVHCACVFVLSVQSLWEKQC